MMRERSLSNCEKKKSIAISGSDIKFKEFVPSHPSQGNVSPPLAEKKEEIGAYIVATRLGALKKLIA